MGLEIVGVAKPIKSLIKLCESNFVGVACSIVYGQVSIAQRQNKEIKSSGATELTFQYTLNTQIVVTWTT